MKYLIGFITQDLVAVPLVVRGIGIGVLEAVNRKNGTFSPADVAWLEVLAPPLAAAVIANARLFEALRRRTSELQARNEELDAFTHTVAHDIQNPLALIIGFAEALQENYDTMPAEELKQHLRKIARTGHRMDNIVEELVLLAKAHKKDVQTRPAATGPKLPTSVPIRGLQPPSEQER